VVKSKTSDLQTALFKGQITRISKLQDVRLIEFCCIFSYIKITRYGVTEIKSYQ